MEKETSFDYRLIDDIIHSRIRLAIMTLLIKNEVADFNYLKQQTKATDGNLSTHLKKLEDVEYVEVNKSFVDRKPQTIYKLTDKGKTAFKEYVKRLESIIK